MMSDNPDPSSIIELSAQQTSILHRYQEITNESNKRRAIDVLRSVDWDLQHAIDITLAIDDDDDDGAGADANLDPHPRPRPHPHFTDQQEQEGTDKNTKVKKKKITPDEDTTDDDDGDIEINNSGRGPSFEPPPPPPPPDGEDDYNVGVLGEWPNESISSDRMNGAQQRRGNMNTAKGTPSGTSAAPTLGCSYSTSSSSSSRRAATATTPTSSTPSSFLRNDNRPQPHHSRIGDYYSPAQYSDIPPYPTDTDTAARDAREARDPYTDHSGGGGILPEEIPEITSYESTASDNTNNSTVGAAAAFDADSDLDQFSAQFDGNELEETSNGHNDERAPLVPSEFTDVVEALQNFRMVFEARYGSEHPMFFMNSLDQAIREAFEAPGRSISEHRPLVIYLHNDNAVASNIFAKNVLCSDGVTSLLNAQFVTFGWDMTQQSNSDAFMGWLRYLHIRDIGIIQRTPEHQYPLLLIIVKEKGIAQVLNFCAGFDRAEDVMQKLVNALEFYQGVKAVEEGEERERQERQMIRQEQTRAYEESLARDRALVEQMERKKQAEEEEEIMRQLAEEQKAKRMKQLADSLPQEPSTDEGVFKVRVRFPDGLFLVRRFARAEPLIDLITFIESKGFDMDHYRVWNSDVPKKDVVETFDLSQTFADLKWPVREQVYVEEK